MSSVGRNWKTPTRGSPTLCALLELEQQTPRVLIVVEHVNVTDTEHKWLAAPLLHAKGYFL